MLRRFRSILAHDSVEHTFAKRLTFHIFVITFENIGLMNGTSVQTGDADAPLQFRAQIGGSTLNYLIADLQAFLLHRIVTGSKKQSEHCKNENSYHRRMFFRPFPRTRRFPGLEIALPGRGLPKNKLCRPTPSDIQYGMRCIFSISKYAIKSLFMAVVLLLTMTRCASTVSRSELDTAESLAQSGQEQALQELFERRQNVREEDRERYVEVIGEGKSDRSSVMLRELYRDPRYKTQRPAILKELIERPGDTNAQFVRKSVTANPELFGPELEAALLQRADRPGAETLLSMVEAGRTALKPESIRLFGETSLQQALPLLIKHADAGRDTGVTMQSIARISTPESEQYIMATAQKGDHPARLDAIRQLAAIPDQDEARAILHSIIKHNPDARVAAFEALSGMEFNEESYDIVAALYHQSDDETTRKAAIQTMAAMRQIDPVALAAELNRGQTEYEESEETDKYTDEKTVKRVEKDQPSLKDAYRDPIRLTDIVKDKNHRKQVVEEEKPVARKKALYRLDESAAASRRYAARLDHSFRRLFGMDAGEVRLKIHNSLLTYAGSNSNSAAFIQRSYQKGFGVEADRSRELLKQGLRLQHSLDAVISNIRREYERRDLQIYALSSFFAIKRKQAEALLDAHRRRNL